jgi:hypothetical protein
MYRVLLFVRAISLSELSERCQVEIEIENLLNLRHPVIPPLIGCVLSVESTGRRKFRTVRLYVTEGSLSDILSNPPAWRAPTMKAKTVVGIELELRFAHGLGLLHGAMKQGNILFDADRRIQIADFSRIYLETGGAEPFSGEGWGPATGVFALAPLLFEVAVRRSAIPPIGSAGGSPLPATVPEFVSSPESSCRSSFADIVARLKESCFKIIATVHSDEVSAFVSSVESSEQGREKQQTEPPQILVRWRRKTQSGTENRRTVPRNRF